MSTDNAAFETALNLLKGIEWNLERATEFAAALDSGALATLRTVLASEDGQRGNQEIVAIVRETIAQEYDDIPEGDPVPVAVVFEPGTYDDGNFLAQSGTVYFSDGTHDEGVDFGDEADAEITGAYGKVGDKAALGIDLRTGAVHFNDYANVVFQSLGVESLDVLRG